jgi:hypothetical protein
LELAACTGGCSNTQHRSDSPDDVFNGRRWMWDLNTWSDKLVREMKHNVSLLMSTAGESSGELDLTKSLPKLLEMFLVGKEQRKAWKERYPPKPSELGLISCMKFQSTAKMGKIVMQKE